MSVFVIDDDEIMAECAVRAVSDVVDGFAEDLLGNSSGGSVKDSVGGSVRVFSNAISAMRALDGEDLPELIFLDVLLDGPDGFTFLNELASYTDTAQIPVVIISSLDFSGKDLSGYGVVGVLDKSSMKPEDIKRYVQEYAS